MQSNAARRWAALIDQSERSGLTNREFAESVGVNVNTFTWWKWRLGGRRRTAVSAQFIEVVEEETFDFEPVFVRVNETVSIEVNDRTDLELLRSVVDALC